MSNGTDFSNHSYENVKLRKPRTSTETADTPKYARLSAEQDDEKRDSRNRSRSVDGLLVVVPESGSLKVTRNNSATTSPHKGLRHTVSDRNSGVSKSQSFPHSTPPKGI